VLFHFFTQTGCLHCTAVPPKFTISHNGPRIVRVWMQLPYTITSYFISFHDVIISLAYIATYEVERMLNKAVVSCAEKPCLHLHGATDENDNWRKDSRRLVQAPLKNHTRWGQPTCSVQKLLTTSLIDLLAVYCKYFSRHQVRLLHFESA